MNETTTNAALYAALAKAQGQFLPIEKNRAVTIRSDKGNYQFRYADLEEILSKTRPALASNGLALIQRIEHTQSGQLLTCLLLHSDGGSLHSEVALPSMGQIADPKKFGAMLTYLRRYMVTAMLGVAADDDLDEDGQEVTNQPQPTGQKPAVAPPKPRQATPPPQVDQHDSPPATQGEIAYITKKIDAAGLTIAQARERAGLMDGNTLEGITKAGFAALKEILK